LHYYSTKSQEWINWHKDYQANGIFSKFTIKKGRNIFIKKPHSKKARDYSNEGRVYIEIELNISGKTLFVGTAHLSYIHKFEIGDRRYAEENNLLKALTKRKKFVFCGDLNAPPDSNIYKALSKKYKHCGPEITQKTWTTKPFSHNGFIENDLNWRLDYVFASRDIEIIETRIIQTDVSDHLPIMVRIRL
jgi:endonuclease/exonuclease/phosphatase family metal-dependent hydrolase